MLLRLLGGQPALMLLLAVPTVKLTFAVMEGAAARIGAFLQAFSSGIACP